MNSIIDASGPALAATLLAVSMLLTAPAAAEPMPSGDSLAIVSSPDGRIEVFFAAVPPSGGIYHAWQLVRYDDFPANTGNWAAWRSWPVVPDPTGQIVATRDPDGRVVVAWISGGSVWYTRQSAPNGATFVDPVRTDTHDLHGLTAATNKDGRIEFFALSTDGAAWSVYQTAVGRWEWASYHIGGTNLKALAPAAYLDGRLALAGLGGDGKAYLTAQTGPGGGWQAWTGLQGEGLTQIAAVANADGRLNVAVIGGDGAFYERSQHRAGEQGLDGWSQWRFRAAGPFTGPLKLRANQDGRLEAVMRRAKSGVAHLWQKSPNGSWTDDAADFPSGLSDGFDLAALTDGRLVVISHRAYLPATPGGHRETSVTAIPQQAVNGTWQVSQSPVSLFQAPQQPPSISIDEFKGDPNHVNLGSPSKLTWSLSWKGGCTPADLSVVREGYGEPEALLFQQATPAATPPLVVYPANSTPVRYRLAVSCKGVPNSTVNRKAEISFSMGPAPVAPYPVLYGPTFVPQTVRDKLPFSVSWMLQNIGTAELAEFGVDLYVDGTKEGDTKQVDALPAGKFTKLSWDVTRELTGFTHSVELKSGTSSLGIAQFSVYP